MSPNENEKNPEVPWEPEFHPVKAILWAAQSFFAVRIGVVHFGSKMAADPTFMNIVIFSLFMIYTIVSITLFIRQGFPPKKKS